MPDRTPDLLVVGGGIVGAATAREAKLRWPNADVLLWEKEVRLGQHQTGHNSGVIHSGIYYAPGSLKARFCREGASETKLIADQHGIPYRECGKLLVATDDLEARRLNDLVLRGAENGIEVTMLSESELRREEPHIRGVAAGFIAETGIIDYGLVSDAFGTDFLQAGGRIAYGKRVVHIREANGQVQVTSSDSERVFARRAVFCGGLQSDRLARMAGLHTGLRIVPFRGEYYKVAPHLVGLVNRLIYPVPDPDLPFLGVHLSPTIGGELTVGPNAVLGLAREGYRKGSIDLRDTWSLATFPGMWRVATNNVRTGLREMQNSLFKSGYLKEVQKYAPSLTSKDLLPSVAGIRAQAVSTAGELVHDFALTQTEHMLHVLNAPSPAATSAAPIARHIIDQL